MSQQISLEELIFLADSQDNPDALEPEDYSSAQEENEPKDLESLQDSEDQDELEESNELETIEDTSSLKNVKESEDSTETEGTENPSEYSNLFNILKEVEFIEEGLLPEDFKFEGDSKSLAKAIELSTASLKSKLAESLVQSFPEEMQPVMEYVLAGGKKVNEFLQQITTPSLDLDSIDLSNIDAQRNIMYQYYKETTKYDDDKIIRLISKLEASGALEEEAEDSINDLKTIQENKARNLIESQKQAKLEQEKREEERRATLIDSVSTQIKDTKRQNKVRAFLVNVSTTPEGSNTEFGRAISSIANNPEHLVQLADILLDYDPKKGLSLDRVKSKLTSEATSSLQQKLEEAANKTKVSGKGSKIPTSQFD
jgi:hypothetical protein